MFRATTETVDHGESKPLLTELLFEEMLQYCQKSGAARSTKHCMSFLGAFYDEVTKLDMKYLRIQYCTVCTCI